MYKYFFKTSLLFWITTAHAQTPCDSTRFNDTLLDKLIGYRDLTGKKSRAKEKTVMGYPSPLYWQIPGKF